MYAVYVERQHSFPIFINHSPLQLTLIFHFAPFVILSRCLRLKINQWKHLTVFFFEGGGDVSSSPTFETSIVVAAANTRVFLNIKPSPHPHPVQPHPPFVSVDEQSNFCSSDTERLIKDWKLYEFLQIKTTSIDDKETSLIKAVYPYKMRRNNASGIFCHFASGTRVWSNFRKWSSFPKLKTVEYNGCD